MVRAVQDSSSLDCVDVEPHILYHLTQVSLLLVDLQRSHETPDGHPHLGGRGLRIEQDLHDHVAEVAGEVGFVVGACPDFAAVDANEVVMASALESDGDGVGIHDSVDFGSALLENPTRTFAVGERLQPIALLAVNDSFELPAADAQQSPKNKSIHFC